MEEESQTWGQHVEEEEEAGHVMSHPDRGWDLSLQSMTRQIPTHSFFGAGTHLTFHKQRKKGGCTVQTRFYRYVNNSVGPSIQQEMFALDLRSSSSVGADSTHHQFHHKAPVCFGLDTARCRNALSSCCISQATSSGQALTASGPMERGWEGGGGCRAESTRSCLPSTLLANVEKSLTNRWLIKTLYGWIQEASSH